MDGTMRTPHWLKMKKPSLGQSLAVNNILKRHQLNTVCQSAKCPNIFECFAKGTATFMILGDTCTRHCRFCAVNHVRAASSKQNNPEQESSYITMDDSNGVKKNQPDTLAKLPSSEHLRVAKACKEMNLKHVVITSVTRDDLKDGGASVFAKTVKAVRKVSANVIIEVLTPDFKGDKDSIAKVESGKPDIFNHNIETVWRLYSEIRPQADYLRSLQLLAQVKKLNPKIITKSGLMLGLGEEKSEVIEALKHLRKANCDAVTLGQYLKPAKGDLTVEVKRFVPPEEFALYRNLGYDLGFKAVAAGPFVRSSYEAQELFADMGEAKSTGS